MQEKAWDLKTLGNPKKTGNIFTHDLAKEQGQSNLALNTQNENGGMNLIINL
jgi:hypothetical protein